jgi:hypothetical protein
VAEGGRPRLGLAQEWKSVRSGRSYDWSMLRLVLVLSTAAGLVIAGILGWSAANAPAGTAPHAHGAHGEGYEPPPPTPPAPPAPPPPAGPRSLVGTVGPAFTIRLRKASGARLGRLAAGQYTITVRDRSSEHNFHLLGPGVNKKTAVAFVGTATWRVRFRKGKVYRFRCDPHLFSMKGSFRIRS